MTQIRCPFCGPRELDEFDFYKTLPNAADTAFERAYLRVDSHTLSREHWQHVRGCRAWLEIDRNPASDEVIEVRMLTGVET
jgi:sarcosine oxidase subunit delta